MLEQSCAALQAAGVTTAANCAAVHQARWPPSCAPRRPTTRSRRTPRRPAPPARTVRVALRQRDRHPGDEVHRRCRWSRNGDPGLGSDRPQRARRRGRTTERPPAASSLADGPPASRCRPARRRTCSSSTWRLLEYSSRAASTTAGTVEINGARRRRRCRGSTARRETINQAAATRPQAGRRFGGDSRGYVASRVDLSSFAGQSVTPQFTFNTDSSASVLGWYVDDIEVYTCDAAAHRRSTRRSSRARRRSRARPWSARS